MEPVFGWAPFFMREKITAFIVCLIALIPNIPIQTTILANTKLWFYFVIVSGTLGFFFLYTKAHILLKITLIFLFVNSIVSQAPYLSMTAYFWIVIIAYFYIFCLEIKSYEFILKGIQCVFFVNLTILILQSFGYDKLFNFGQKQITYMGILGNRTIQGSFLIMLMPYLMMYRKINFIPMGLTILIYKSFGGLLSLLGGLLFLLKKKWLILLILIILIFSFAYKNRIAANYRIGRWVAWKKTIQLTNEHPFFGYGMGTYKAIFPAKTGDFGIGDKLVWEQAHNCFLQIGFECGYIVLGLLVTFISWLFYRLYKLKNKILLSGLMMIIINMTWSFPTRMCQVVPLLILFLAICTKEVIYDRFTNS